MYPLLLRFNGYLVQCDGDEIVIVPVSHEVHLQFTEVELQLVSVDLVVDGLCALARLNCAAECLSVFLLL